MPIEQNANKALAQIAVCEKVATMNTSKGPKPVYTLSLEGKTFEVWGGQYFSANVGEKFRPVVDIVPRAYMGKDNKPRANNQPIVNWEKVG